MRVEIIVPPDFQRGVIEDIEQIMVTDAKELRKIMIEEFHRPKHGREYRRARGPHRASAPGEPPAYDTGTLERSITEPHAHKLSTGVVVEVDIDAPYAAELEYGRAGIAARPFVEPAIEELIRRAA